MNAHGNNHSATSDNEKCTHMIEALRRLYAEDGEASSCLDKLVVGRTMVLYKAEAHIFLEELRAHAVALSTKLVNRVVRGFMARIRASEFVGLLNSVSRHMEQRDADGLEASLSRCSQVKFVHPLVQRGRALSERLKREIQVMERVRKCVREGEGGVEGGRGGEVEGGEVVVLVDVRKEFPLVRGLLQEAEALDIDRLYPHMIPPLRALRLALDLVREEMELR